MRSEIIRPYLEKLIGQWLEVPALATDNEGRYHVRVATSGFIVELIDFEPTLVRVWSPVVVGVEPSVELLQTLNDLNGSGFGLRVFHLDDTVVRATELVAETLDAKELDFACHLLAGAAERLGPELVALYGGSTLFEPRSDVDGDGDIPSSSLLTSGGYL
jgi:hypothetical protein